MDQSGMTVSDLGEILGYRSRASEILSRKRKLTLPMMRRLHEKLGISPRILTSAYK
jgi:HTH-type transcriptional regulator / antitoxin HigA